MIDISKEDFGTLCICALRYCYGRRTYMPSLVQEIVSEHFRDLDNGSLVVIANDEAYQRGADLWGDKYDKVRWENFYKALNEYRKGASK
jgi:hypothetical protein